MVRRTTTEINHNDYLTSFGFGSLFLAPSFDAVVAVIACVVVWALSFQFPDGEGTPVATLEQHLQNG